MNRNRTTMRGCSSRGEDVKESSRAGRFRVSSVLALASLFLSGAGYLFSVNQNAVAGYSMRVAEKRMAELSNESQRLRIREAELRSLYGLEEASSRLDMKPIEDAVSLDEPGPVAFGR